MNSYELTKIMDSLQTAGQWISMPMFLDYPRIDFRNYALGKPNGISNSKS
jgi:hypothetical protein